MDLIAQVRQHLAETVDGLPKSLCAFLATYDGHLIEVYGKQPIDVEALLPMASSMLALGQAIATGMEPGHGMDDFFVRSQGRILSMMDVGDRDNALCVGIIAERMVNLGQLLVRGRACADHIRDIV